MTFEDYWAGLDKEQRWLLAKRAGTTAAYLSEIAYGRARPSWDLAVRLEKAALHWKAEEFLRGKSKQQRAKGDHGRDAGDQGPA